MNPKHPVVCFGEVLWDILPGGAVPGGAPMNVAFHLQQLKKNPVLITKIGNDEEGRKLKTIFSKRGVCTDFFQIDECYETGKVYGRPNDDDEMVYDIVKPSAWDFIDLQNNHTDLVQQADYFVYGSLAARTQHTGRTLFQLLEAAKKPVLDINLRIPHFTPQLLRELLSKAQFLKLNQTELKFVSSWFCDYKLIEEQMQVVMERFHIADMVVTMGEHGAVLNMNQTFYRQEGFNVTVADTVGSGDAFLAGLLSKLLEGKSGQEALEFACVIGSFIATKHGACPMYELHDIKIPMETC
ncbi:carbohydrate kinase [Lacibacter sp. H375]|uniref:carbohydrate kinase family protein n=1 Tax=Lacibacter sp. H375 TaxID=3133424 RepID=UPI0030C28A69